MALFGSHCMFANAFSVLLTHWTDAQEDEGSVQHSGLHDVQLHGIICETLCKIIA